MKSIRGRLFQLERSAGERAGPPELRNIFWRFRGHESWAETRDGKPISDLPERAGFSDDFLQWVDEVLEDPASRAELAKRPKGGPRPAEAAFRDAIRWERLIYQRRTGEDLTAGLIWSRVLAGHYQGMTWSEARNVLER